MADITNYIINNKEWIFSGIGVFFLTLLVGLLFRQGTAKSSQNIKAGDNSTNIQVGGDMNSGTQQKRDNKKKN